MTKPVVDRPGYGAQARQDHMGSARCPLCPLRKDEAYSCHVQRFRRDVGIATAREFARYRLLRVPFIGVPRAVVRDRHAGRREARAVPAQGPMQADFFRHQADIWQAVAA